MQFGVGIERSASAVAFTSAWSYPLCHCHFPDSKKVLGSSTQEILNHTYAVFWCDLMQVIDAKANSLTTLQPFSATLRIQLRWIYFILTIYTLIYTCSISCFMLQSLYVCIDYFLWEMVEPCVGGLSTYSDFVWLSFCDGSKPMALRRDHTLHKSAGWSLKVKGWQIHGIILV